jgi:ribulose-phosphate 3-epimerase
MVEIIPAILPQSLGEIHSKLEQVRAFAKTVQIDLVDGVYAPNTTWPFTTQEALPKKTLSEDTVLQFDCMLVKPQDQVLSCIELGGRELIVHATSEGSSSAVVFLQQMRNDRPPVRVGVALLSTATTEDLKPFEGLFDFVQVMGIERVGFQGQPFSSQSLSLVQKVRETYPELPVQVDGAVSMENVRALCDAGATELVVGSAVFSAENSHEAIAALTKAANAV